MEYEPKQLRRLQLALLEIAKDIDRVCRENDIEYFLDSGSCLGAMRHGGFIPWDDDVDLGMMREDYNRFLEVAPDALGEDYVMAHPGNSDRLAGQFAKVWKRGTVFATEETIEAGIDQGIFIDIFPFDEVCADEAAARKQLRSCRIWQSISYLYHSKSINVPDGGIMGAAERAACAVVHGIVRALLDPDRIRGKFEQSAFQGAADGSGVYVNMCYAQGGSFRRDILLPTATLEFEGHPFPAPADPEAYLEIAYGKTWRELPPECQRRNHAPVKLDFGA